MRLPSPQKKTMLENPVYQKYLKKRAEDYENLCKRCGACCGALESDPCSHLMKFNDDRYGCRVYEERFGMHRTVSGKEFQCVPLKKILFESWSGSWRCAYKERSKV